MSDYLRIILRLIGFLGPYWRRVLLAYGAMLSSTLLALIVPKIIGWSVDAALAEPGAESISSDDLSGIPFLADLEALAAAEGPRFLLWAAGLILLLAAGRSVLGFAELYLGAWLSQRAAYDIRKNFFGHLQYLSFQFHDRAQSGDLMSRAIGDISRVQQFLGQGLLEAVYIPVLFVSVSVLLFLASPSLAIAAILPLLVLVAVTLRFAQIIEPRFKAVRDQEGVISTRAQENFTGMRVVKAFAREPWEIQRFSNANEKFYRRRIRVIATFADYFPLMNGIVVVSILLVLWLGGRQVLAGEISEGTLTSFIFWVVLLAQPTQNLGFIVNRAAEAVASGRRLFEILDAESAVRELPNARDPGRLDGRVSFENVSFSYDGKREVLTDISFDIPAGMRVALFGATGSGKSSVVRLIPRFYDLAEDEGAIRIDGIDVKDLALDPLRQQVAMVLQDTFLFSASIAENIAYGRPEAEQAEIEAAAKAARAHDFINELTEGYGTIIGERGVTLSGGQRQRIAIARALLVNPRVLILDDATSAVDTETEHEIQSALDVLMRGRTSFVIAQRLLSLKKADLILVMEGGRIVARGNHEQLMEQGGAYAKVYDLQMRDQDALAAELGQQDLAPDEVGAGEGAEA